MKRRTLLGTNTLDKVKEYRKKRIPVTIIYKLLKLEPHIHYRTAIDQISADEKGLKTARPSWLQPNPVVQQAPHGWRLERGFEVGYWLNNGVKSN